jgi:hypothetical protein
MAAGHGHDHDAAAHDAHDDFDPEPAKELGPGEPRSPAWLPLLGACLFLAGGVYFLTSGNEAKAGAAPSASAAPAKPAVAPPAPPPPPAPTARATAAGSGRPALDPEQRQKMLDRARQARPIPRDAEKK